MNNVDELPSWAARTHVPSNELLEPEPPPKKRRSFRPLLFGLLGLLALAGMAALGFWVATLTDDGNTATSSGNTESTLASQPDDGATADDVDGATSAGADSADDPATATTVTETEDSTDAAPAAGDAADSDDSSQSASAADAPTGEPVDNSDGSIRYAVLKGGQLFLRGRVHSEEYGNQIEQVALGVLGPGNVINEYEVDPTTPETIGGPVYVEDVVLFGFDSIEVAPPFLPILDLGTALMLQNPTVEIEVVSRTDSVGSEAVNLEVSRLRGEAVVNYWITQGIDPSRVTIDARGEEQAVETDDPEDAALNRRVEFVIRKLFG